MRHFWVFLVFTFTVLTLPAGPNDAIPLDQQLLKALQQGLFQEYGYLQIKNFFSKKEVEALRNWADEIHRDSQDLLVLSQASGNSLQWFAKNNPDALIVVPEAKNPLQVCRAEDLLTCYPDLHQFISSRLTSYISYLLDEPYVLFKDKINFKWPGGGAFTPHQDFPAYEPFGPREHITAMVCIDPATLENGCLQVADDWKWTFANDPAIDPVLLNCGRAVLPYIEGGKDHGSIQPQLCEKIRWLPLVASPGDVVLISSFVPHYSEPNTSNAPRRAMFFTHNRLTEGEHRSAYYKAKRDDPDNPLFHIGTPTSARSK